MTRIILIRFIEAFFRYPKTIIITGALFGLAIYLPIYLYVEKTEYIFGLTIFQQSNDVIDSYRANQQLQLAYWSEAEIIQEELFGLIGTDAFMDEVMRRIDLSKPEHYTSLNGSPRRFKEYVRDSILIEVIEGTETKVAMVTYSENPNVAKQLSFVIFDLYIEFKIAEGKVSDDAFTRAFQNALDGKKRREEAVIQELIDYVNAHPEHEFFDRRDIEQFQISLLQEELETLDRDIQFYEDRLELLNFATVTSERNARETYLMLDTPTQAFQVYSRSSLPKALAFFILYSGASAAFLLVLFAFFDQRVTLPIDIQNITNKPILTIVKHEKEDQPLLAWLTRRRRRRRGKPITRRKFSVGKEKLPRTA